MKKFGTLACAAVLALSSVTGSVPARAEDELKVFDWAGYEDQNLFPEYVEKYGGSPSFTFFSDDTEALQKVRSGYVVDVIHPCTATMGRWKSEELIKPIDTSRLSRWDDIASGLKDHSSIQSDGKVWMVPFDFGADSIIYRKDLIPDIEHSVQAFLDPKYAGKIALPGNPMDLIALGSLGIGLGTKEVMNEAQLEDAIEFLRAVHKNVRLYWSDPTELAQVMASGEVVLAFGWNDIAAKLKGTGLDIVYMTDVKEGMAPWVCGYTISANGGNEERVYDFLNALTDPKVSVYLASAWGYGHSNAKGEDAVPEEVANGVWLNDVRDFIDKNGFYYSLPEELRGRAVEAVTRVKAGF